MRFVIVTGMSGAGKSSVLKMLEDVGYFCIDNLPILLVPRLAELLAVPNAEINKIALGMDIRSSYGSADLGMALDELDELGIVYEMLYLDASDEVLVKRYKETRRSHPLSGNSRVDQGIRRERAALEPLRRRANYILDTSRLLIRELKREINSIFVENKEYKNLYVTVLSFGFKYGIPNDADLVFDVRFLPNPYYIEELRPKSGNDKEVQDYVMSNEKAGEFLGKLTDMVQFLIPNYITEGKTQLVIGVGCTGGKHRSVTLANALYEALVAAESDYGVKIEHRDIEKDAITKAK
ncbi:MAG: RNase adapter RapZ [Eubacteriales bacterium]|nr:RNase adapter RapZ [Eubacteriales bacterium]